LKNPSSQSALDALKAFDLANITPVKLQAEQFEQFHMVMTDDKKNPVKLVPNRMLSGDGVAFIDWINFTIHESTLCDSGFESQCFSDTDYMVYFSAVLSKIFGFGLTARMATGSDFYQKRWMLGSDCGFVCFGGNASTILVKLSGTGCSAALSGWESRLKNFLEYKAVQPRITRIDLTHDVFKGDTYSVDRAMSDYEAGLFSAGGRMPNVETRGNWHTPNGKGRTLYVGSRSNGKFLRVYEKGRELGDQSSEWCRIEVEVKSIDRIIPFDTLLHPGQYLAATYPAFNHLSVKQCRIETISRSAKAGYVHMTDWLKHQCGPSLALVEEIEGSAQAAFDKVKRPFELRGPLLIPSIDFPVLPLHLRERFQPVDMAIPE
jgi:phage replication initiation protein